ncbi:MAG: UDP-glucose--hexose-1-phosphate uridylyltransferase [Oscillospiraceae bacterium]|nr:UDP-glucose--hexose-1-phosphate uridylyltransferase [Oscillospiraceae bacterium]
MIYNAIEALVQYAFDRGLIDESEIVYSRNRLLDVLREDGFAAAQPMDGALSELLKILTDHAVQKGLCADTTESRDIFDTRLMNCLTPRPAEVNRRFAERYAVSPEAATDWFYRFSGDVNYIRRDRIARDRRWKVDSDYGQIDITINLSKPEKDPRDIAAAGKTVSVAYPACQLCVENVGYAGRIGHPARANHRTIPLTLNGESWFLQYSPYVYYNEHCIALNSRHVPMKIDRRAFARLFDFVRLFPHYFIGSNADLPIVGGSILSHDHFQGGRYEFAMAKAGVEHGFTVPGYEDVQCGTVKWPLSVIRLRGKDSARLADLAAHILGKWRGYTDESATIFAETDGVPHNTITPIARRRGEDYEIDLCLRNNLTTPEHPLGVYHPHAERHHIKKENIGLIEVMGLAVLPARLQKELELLEQFIAEGKDIASDEAIAKHAAWASRFAPALRSQPREVIRAALENEVGKVFLAVLEDAGVFKRDEAGKAAFLRFIAAL